MANALSDRLDIDAERLREAFNHREALSSTIIQPGLAIPHIIVDGDRLFEIVLVRCRDGVVFPGHDRLVRIIFALVGSEDQRNYHLKALMAIAHIIGEHGFVRRWLAATSAEHLRDIILLSARKREAQDSKR